MNAQTKRSPLKIVELWLVLLFPLAAIVAGAAMIHVAADSGFTALGEPAVVTAADVRR